MTATRVRIGIAVLVVAALAAGVWWWTTRNRESTDDAQVDAGVTPIAARVGGTVVSVPIVDNQQVNEGTVLVEIDKRDYEIALERARAELADAEASAAAARAGVPITSTTAASNVTTAQRRRGAGHLGSERRGAGDRGRQGAARHGARAAA